MIKIFLVEDEMIIRRGIKNSIEWEKEGYQFAGEASDGELAFPMILREKPDIVLTDIKMPFMDGLELSRLIRKELPETKILILSGYDEFEYAKEAIRIGITDYLLKPVSSTRLLEALDDVRRKIEQEKEEKALLIQYQKEMQENMEHEKEKFLNVLLNGTMSVGDAIRQASQYRLNLTAGMYNFLLFKIWTDDRQEDESSGIVDAFNNIETAADHMPGICRFQRGIEGWAFLLTGEDMEELTQKEEMLTAKLKETMSRYPGLETADAGASDFIPDGGICVFKKICGGAGSDSEKRRSDKEKQRAGRNYRSWKHGEKPRHAGKVSEKWYTGRTWKFPSDLF